MNKENKECTIVMKTTQLVPKPIYKLFTVVTAGNWIW